MTVELTWQTLITAAAVIAAAAAIGAHFAKLVRWIDHQKEQDRRMDALEARAKNDQDEINEELCLITYGVLACLKGLHEQGCNGPVTEAIGKFDKHINQKAHGQK